MSDDPIVGLAEQLARMMSEMAHLRRILIFQSSAIDALRQYIVAHSTDPKAAQEEIAAETQRAHDARISRLEEIDPATSASADIRQHLSESDQIEWYLPPPKRPPQ